MEFAPSDGSSTQVTGLLLDFWASRAEGGEVTSECQLGLRNVVSDTLRVHGAFLGKEL